MITYAYQKWYHILWEIIFNDYQHFYQQISDAKCIKQKEVECSTDEQENKIDDVQVKVKDYRISKM